MWGRSSSGCASWCRRRIAPSSTSTRSRSRTARLVPALWRKAVDVGWPGILVPAEHGGSESTLTDAAVLFEELGRGPVPGPFWSSGVLGALIVLEAASAQQRNAILPAVARGEIILSVAITDPNTSWGPQAVTLRPQRLGDRFRLDGTKLFVSDATAATHLIVAVRTGDGPADVSLLMVDARARAVRARRLPGFLSWQDEGTPGRRRRAPGQSGRERGLPRSVQRRPRGARRPGQPHRVRPGRPHPDVAHALRLPRRSALAQAPHGRRARMVVRAETRRAARRAVKCSAVVRAEARSATRRAVKCSAVVRAEARSATRRAVKCSVSCEPRHAGRRGER